MRTASAVAPLLSALLATACTEPPLDIGEACMLHVGGATDPPTGVQLKIPADQSTTLRGPCAGPACCRFGGGRTTVVVLLR